MKKQKKRQGPTTSTAVEEKKIKTEETEKKELEEEEEEETANALAAAVAAVKEEEEMKLWGMGLKGDDVDEQMTWGMIWFPFWDVEFVGRNYGALFSDVVWDDDIWNLRTISEIPKNVNRV